MEGTVSRQEGCHAESIDARCRVERAEQPAEMARREKVLTALGPEQGAGAEEIGGQEC